MPKETFFNLSDEKRTRILGIIVDEFSENDFKSVSINRICEGAGIPKGSFYQYFKNKKDVYMYLLQYIGEKKMLYFQALEEDPDFFNLLRQMYAAGVEFAYKNPKLFNIGKHFMNLSKADRIEILGPLGDQSDAYLENMFVEGIRKGVLRDDLDIKIMVRLLTDMSSSISEYYMLNLKQDQINKATFLEIANKMIDMLENGIRIREA